MGISSHIIMLRFIALAAIVASATARPDGPPPPGYAPAPYKPAPAPYKPEEKLPPQPYTYDYGIVEGSYKVSLPDGRIQTVTYHADHEGGFVADVTYEGTPVYPDPPKGGYGPYKGPGAYKGPAPSPYKPAPPAPVYGPAASRR